MQPTEARGAEGAFRSLLQRFLAVAKDVYHQISEDERVECWGGCSEERGIWSVEPRG